MSDIKNKSVVVTPTKKIELTSDELAILFFLWSQGRASKKKILYEVDLDHPEKFSEYMESLEDKGLIQGWIGDWWECLRYF